jgi:hypothetical protein
MMSNCLNPQISWSDVNVTSLVNIIRPRHCVDEPVADGRPVLAP